MIMFLSKFLTWWIPGSARRREARRKTRSWFWSRELRRKAIIQADSLYCGGPVGVCCPNVEISDHANFNGGQLLGRGRIRIGRYFHSGRGLIVMTENHNYEGESIPYDNTFRVKDVVVGDFVWVGVDVIILPGTTIGKGAIIQAGSVVHGAIPDYAIAGGNPAKVFAFRDKAHFDALERKGAFH